MYYSGEAEGHGKVHFFSSFPYSLELTTKFTKCVVTFSLFITASSYSQLFFESSTYFTEGVQWFISKVQGTGVGGGGVLRNLVQGWGVQHFPGDIPISLSSSPKAGTVLGNRYYRGQ